MRASFLIAAVAVVVVAAAAARAQSLGDVARRERERRAASRQQGLPVPPVITNEDLKRERILPQTFAPQPSSQVPGPAASIPIASSDQAASNLVDSGSAARVPEDSAAASVSVPLWNMHRQPGFSLGEYARRLRERRQSREAGGAELAQSEEPARESAPVAAAQQQPSDVPPKPTASENTAKEKLGLGHSAVHIVGAPRSGALLVALRSNALPHSALELPDPIRVRRGDSLWKLAAIYLGEGRLWMAFWKSNPEVRNPSLLYAGQLLRWPGAVEIAAARETTHARRQQASWCPSSLSGESLRIVASPALAGSVGDGVKGDQFREKNPRSEPPSSSSSSPSASGRKASRSSSAERNSSCQATVSS